MLIYRASNSFYVCWIRFLFILFWFIMILYKKLCKMYVDLCWFSLAQQLAARQRPRGFLAPGFPGRRPPPGLAPRTGAPLGPPSRQPPGKPAPRPSNPAPTALNPINDKTNPILWFCIDFILISCWCMYSNNHVVAVGPHMLIHVNLYWS